MLAIILRCQIFAGDKSEGNKYDCSLVLLDLFYDPSKLIHSLSEQKKRQKWKKDWEET